MNRMACLRLTQRCADILISVRQEIEEAGGEVTAELREPVAKLVRYARALSFMALRSNWTNSYM